MLQRLVHYKCVKKLFQECYAWKQGLIRGQILRQVVVKFPLFHLHPPRLIKRSGNTLKRFDEKKNSFHMLLLKGYFLGKIALGKYVKMKFSLCERDKNLVSVLNII